MEYEIMEKALKLELLLTTTQAYEDVCDQRWVLEAMAEHGLGIINILWRILGNDDDVCDAYQETFLKLAGRTALQDKTKIKAYLFRTASNAAIDILRRNERRKKLHEDLAVQKRKMVQGERFDFDTRRLIDLLREKLLCLPDSLQKVIMLRDIGEMTYRDVAEVLEISPEAARVYRRRAVIMLAELMSRSERE